LDVGAPAGAPPPLLPLGLLIAPRALPSRPGPLPCAAQLIKDHVGKCKSKACQSASPSVLRASREELIGVCEASNAFRSARDKLGAPSAHGVPSGSSYASVAVNAVAAGFVAANGARAIKDSSSSKRTVQEFKWVSGLRVLVQLSNLPRFLP